MIDRYFNISYDKNINKFLFLITIFSVCSGLFLSLLLYKITYLKTLFVIIGLLGTFFIFRFPDLGVVLSFSSAIFKEWLTDIIPLFAAFDFTIAIFGLTFLSIIFSSIKNGMLFEIKFHKSFIPLLLFTAYLIFTTLYTPSFNYGNLKAFSFLTFNLFLFITPILVISEDKYAWRMIYFLIALGVVISIYSLITLVRSILTLEIIYTYRATFLGVNSIGFANWIASINILLISILPTIKKKKHRIAAVSIIFLFLIAMVVTNSRGPLLSFIVSVLLIFSIRAKKIPAKKIILIFLSIVVFVIIIFTILPPQLIDRYVGIVDQGQNVSKRVAFYTVSTRLDFWKASLRTATDSLQNLFFGIGSGGFSMMYYHKDFLWYPHNIFIEVLCELGMLGLILLIWHFSLIFKDGVKLLFKKFPSKQKHLLFAFILAAFFNIMAAQFSGDLNRNRKIWFFLGVITALISIYENKKKTLTQYV